VLEAGSSQRLGDLTIRGVTWRKPGGTAARLEDAANANAPEIQGDVLTALEGETADILGTYLDVQNRSIRREAPDVGDKC
jgi:hypothetical protein